MYQLIYLQGTRWTPINSPANYAVCKAKEKEYKGRRGFVKLHIVKSTTNLINHVWQ